METPQPPPIHAGPPLKGPDFLCIGQQKAGTRSLYDLLSAQPEFWMPPVKELHYFNYGLRRGSLEVYAERAGFTVEEIEAPPSDAAPTDNRARDLEFLRRYAQARRCAGPVSLEDYCRLFQPGGDRITGDITPAYNLLSAGNAAKVLSRLPSVKVIYLARDPVERAFSNINHHLRIQAKSQPSRKDRNRLLRQIDDEDLGNDRLQELLSLKSIANRSFASRHLAAWWPVTPEENRLVLFFDDLVEAPERWLAALARFFDMPDTPGRISRIENAKRRVRKHRMTLANRELLANFFCNELMAQQRLFGGRSVEWLRRYDCYFD